jgi:hypothetical protein
MIPLSTPPGAELICIDDWPCPVHGETGLKLGAVYTLAYWNDKPDGAFYPFLALVEQPLGPRKVYSPSLFRLLIVPEQLTALLAGKGNLRNEPVEPATHWETPTYVETTIDGDA